MNKKDLNTPIFWDNLIINKRKSLFTSPIYLDKNKKIISILRKISGNILDVGVGYGYIEEALTNEKSRLKLYGIDISPESIQNLKKRYGDNFRIGKTIAIPFKNNFFNCVLVLDVMEHIAKNYSKKSFNEFKRVLKKDGKLIVSVPLNDTKIDFIENGHLRRYTTVSISSEIKSAGFEILSVTELTAFRTLYTLKKFLTTLFPFIKRKSNLVIIFAQKKK